MPCERSRGDRRLPRPDGDRPGRATVFRSLLRNGSVVGERSVVVGSELDVAQVVPPRTIYANDEVFGPVEW